MGWGGDLPPPPRMCVEWTGALPPAPMPMMGKGMMGKGMPPGKGMMGKGMGAPKGVGGTHASLDGSADQMRAPILAQPHRTRPVPGGGGAAGPSWGFSRDGILFFPPWMTQPTQDGPQARGLANGRSGAGSKVENNAFRQRFF